MARYLRHGSDTLAGIQGVLRDGGTSRVKAVESLVGSLGGSLESMYFAFGKDDFYVTADLPGNIEAAAIAATVGAAGGATTSTVVLLTADEMDAAVKLHPIYRAPGA